MSSIKIVYSLNSYEWELEEISNLDSIDNNMFNKLVEKVINDFSPKASRPKNPCNLVWQMDENTFHSIFGEIYRKHLVNKNIKNPSLLAQLDSQICCIDILPSGLGIFADLRNVVWC